MKIGDLFRFKYNLCPNIYEVISIKCIECNCKSYKKNKNQMVCYKYRYSHKNLYPSFMVCYVYDYLLDLGSIIRVRQPWQPECSDKDYIPKV